MVCTDSTFDTRFSRNFPAGSILIGPMHMHAACIHNAKSHQLLLLQLLACSARGSGCNFHVACCTQKQV